MEAKRLKLAKDEGKVQSDTDDTDSNDGDNEKQVTRIFKLGVGWCDTTIVHSPHHRFQVYGELTTTGAVINMCISYECELPV